MQNLPFIFSNDWRYRLARHLIFWLTVLFGMGMLGMSMRPLFNVGVSQGSFREHILQPLLYLPGQLLLVYTLLYFVIPSYMLTSKYRIGFLWVLMLTIVAGFTATLSYDLLLPWFNRAMHRGTNFLVIAGRRIQLTEQLDPLVQRLPTDFFFGLQAVLNVAGFAAAIRLLKHWYEKEYLNNILQKEKLDAELRSLKAQLHPHFLFNTLNNIYSMTENVSPAATAMVLKLSDLLRYILYDCDRPLVPLSQEFRLIADYIDLERVRYRDLDLAVHLPADTEQYTIAPLLLLPLVENCFKHGASQLLEHPWIRIDADVKDGWLYVKLINSTPSRGPGKPSPIPGMATCDHVDEFKEGIGLGNVRGRLNLLYPGKHELSILSEQEIFIVNLKLQNTATHE